MTNLGSLFPEPKGARELTSLKNSSFNALGAITESKYKFKSFEDLENNFSKI